MRALGNNPVFFALQVFMNIEVFSLTPSTLT